MVRCSTLAFLFVPLGHGLAAEQTTTHRANPVRKVVNMLDSMLKKVEAEGETEEKLFNKFMCYCKNGRGSLEKSIADAESKIPQVSSAIEATTAGIKQLAGDLVAAKTNRDDAEKSLSDATALREREATEYAKVSGDFATNIEAMGKAIAALEKGAGASFLQSSAVPFLRQISLKMDVSPADRDVLSSFLSSGDGSGYTMQSGEITGILKQMKETMEADSAEAKTSEEGAIKAFEGLSKAKTNEIKALTSEIEAKTVREGEAKVELVTLKADLSDTEKGLVEDKKFLSEMAKSCSTKQAEWDERQKVRAEEMLAIHETIKILNDDDALELFKKTLPGSFVQAQEVSLLQMQANAKAMRREAVKLLANKRTDVRVNLIALALQGKKVDMDQVVKMIDDMTVLLGEEQGADDSKKAYCEKELDETEDTIKELELKVSDLEKAIAEAQDAVSTLTSEIKALGDGIIDLDKNVAAATEQRKEENAEYVQTLAANNKAVNLLNLAKDRLGKFYNGGVALAELREDAGQAPSTWEGDYKKKGEESNGVVAMINALIADVEKEIQEMEVEEKNAQGDYETLLKDSSEKRAVDAKSIKEKEGSKAELEAKLLKYSEKMGMTKKEVLLNIDTLGNLHKECDWLLENYAARREARAGEVESMKKAKAVLSGANYAMLQSPALIQISEHTQQAPEDKLAAEMTHDLEMNFNKIAPFGKEDTAKELQDHASKTQDTLVDAVENAEVAEIKRAVFRALTRLRAATIKEFDTIARLETQAIDAYNDAHHYRAENPLAHLHEDEAPVETDKLKSFH